MQNPEPRTKTNNAAIRAIRIFGMAVSKHHSPGLIRALLFLVFLIATFLKAGALRASEDSDVLFHSSFDGTAEAQVAKGGGTPRVVGPLAFKPGLFGQALVAGEKGAVVLYPSPKNIPMEKGTIELWLLPVKWDLVEGIPGSTSAHHVFFQTGFSGANGWKWDSGDAYLSAGSWLQVYKFFSNSCTASLIGSDKGVVIGLLEYIPLPGRWVHIVATWEGDHQILYVNGQAAPGAAAPVTKILQEFLVGDIAWHVARKAQETWIDDFRVLSRPLSATEVQASYARGIVAESQYPDLLAAPLIAQPPAIDGKETSAGEWATATGVRGFRTSEPPAGSALAVDEALQLNVAHGTNGLYLRVVRPLESGVTLVATPKPQDADLTGDDGVEVQIAPGWDGNGEPTNGFRFALNLVGSRGEARSSDGGKTWDPAWSGAWTGAASTEGQQRSYELTIPWETLGRTAADRTPLGLRVISRNLVAGSTVKQAEWSGQKGWGLLSLRDDARAVKVLKFTCDAQGKTVVESEFANSSTAPVALQLFAEAPGTMLYGLGKQDVSEAGIPAGGVKKFAVAGRIGDQSATWFQAGQLDTQGNWFWRTTLPVAVEKGATLDLTLRPSIGVGKLQVDIRGTGFTPDANNPVRILLTEKGGAKAHYTKSVDTFTDGVATLDIPIADLPAGEYELKSVFHPPGASTPVEKVVPITKPSSEWSGNQVGVLPTDQVPKPWTPLVVKKPDNSWWAKLLSHLPEGLAPKRDNSTTVSCWGRDFVFAENSPLPRQITSQGHDLLASPMAFAATNGGQVTTWTPGSFTIESASPSAVTFKGTGTIGAGKIAVTGRIEYDGMLWLDVDADLAGTAFERLEFVAPMPADIARYRMLPDISKNSVQVNRPKEEPWEVGLNYYLWFGNEDVGLSWFTESANGWPGDGKRRLAITSGGDNVNVFNVRLMESGAAGAKGAFAFGLQPTPMRPLPPDWRRVARKGNLLSWTTPKNTLYQGYPEVGDDGGESLTNTVDVGHGLGMKVISYLGSSMLSTAAPEWKYYGKEWYSPGRDYPFIGEGEAHHKEIVGVCPQSRQWRDFVVWKSQDYLKKWNLDGIYHDFEPPTVCNNTLHGCESKRMPILAYRDLHKRLYNMQQAVTAERGTASLYMHHTSINSSGLCTPMLSFSDCIADNEGLASMISTYGADLFIRQVPLEYFRTRGSGKPLGLWNNFIFNRSPFLRGNLGMYLIHDIHGYWNNDFESLIPLLRPLDRFGITEPDVKFLGYWQKNLLVTLTPPGGEEALVSLYQRPGCIIAVVMNRSKVEKRATVTFDLAALGLSAKPVFTELYGDPLAAVGTKSATVDIPPGDFRIVAASNEPLPPPLSEQLPQTFSGTKLTGGTVRGGAGAAAAFDGNTETLYQTAPDARPCWIGKDLGAARKISGVRLIPSNYFFRSAFMHGGLIQGSNDPNFVSGVVTLAAIPGYPAMDKWTELPVKDPQAYRYVRLFFPVEKERPRGISGAAGAAEIEFFTDEPTNKLTGTVISENISPDYPASKAFDGDTSQGSFADRKSWDTPAWVGLDLGSSKPLSEVRIFPRQTLASRLVGAKIQGSNTPDFSGAVDLATISTAPAENTFTGFPVNGSFRYVRLMTINDWLSVAEIEVYGK